MLTCFAFEGQTSGVDSLQAVIAAAPDDTAKVWLYRDLYKTYYGMNEPEEMIRVAGKGLDLSRKLNYPKGLDYMIFYMATALDIAGRGDEAIPFYEEGLAQSKKSGDESGAADYFINLGVAHYHRGDLELALTNYLGALDIYERKNEKEKLAKVLNNIGIVYRTQEKYQQAESIYQRSFQLKKDLNDSLGMAASLQNLGAVYSMLENNERAVEHLEQALALYRKVNSPKDVASSYITLGEVYLKDNKLSQAKSAFEQAWRFFKLNPSVTYSPNALQGLGHVAMQQKNFADAENYFRQSLAFSRDFEQKEIRLRLLNNLAESLHQQGKNAEAFLFKNEAYALRDSLTEEKRLSLLEEMQTRFDVKQKENELRISQLELQERTRQRNGFIFGAVFLGLLALAVFFLLRNRIRANKKIATQNAEIQRQQIQQLQQEKKLTALSSMLEGQEQERMRIAHDLHDSLGGLLASVRAHFNSLNGNTAQQPLFEKTDQLINEAYGEVRRISHNMMPRALALAGLPGALEDLAQNLRQQGLACELEIIGLNGESLPQARAMNLYRIVQELTNNVLKHAGAKNLLLQLIQQNGELTIIVEDDGQGFDLSEAQQRNGLGMSSITSRVEFLQGNIEWDPVPGEGTTVSVRVPM